MANIAVPMQKSLLDWSLGGATPTRPGGQFLGLSLSAPTSAASNEVATGSGYVRSSCAFGAAGTPTSSGTATNASALTYGPFSSSAVINGLFVADTVSSAAGTGLYYGTLTTIRTVLPGDSLVIGAAALTITLS